MEASHRLDHRLVFFVAHFRKLGREVPDERAIVTPGLGVDVEVLQATNEPGVAVVVLRAHEVVVRNVAIPPIAPLRAP